MDDHQDSDDRIGPWSEQKLNLLRRYLTEYVKILSRQSMIRGFHYVDGFAGTGRPRARDEERFINGSPRVALELATPFTSYTFIEKNPRRAAILERLREEYPDRDIKVYSDDCNKVLTQEITPVIRHERFQRGIVFLDPFGMELEWATIERIAETRALEIFLNIPTLALNRTTLVNAPNALTAVQIERMNRFWGSEEWRDDIYETVPGLFGPMEIKIRPTTGMRLGRLFQERLREVFPYVADPVLMTNATNGPLYCLTFAGHNETGMRIAGHILKHHARLGQT